VARILIQTWYERYVWPCFLFIWLRSRIRYNQLTRTTQLAQALTVLGVLIIGFGVVGISVGGTLLGALLPRAIGVENYVLIWDFAAVGALLMWMIHVLNEAQRGDPISMDRILHLPVSPGQAFVVNYLSSLGSVVFLMTAGGFCGLILGSIFSVGVRAIAFLVPASAFLFAMTAVTYWLQGWLATWMANPRKRQTVIVLIPIAIITVVQLPIQIINWTVDSERRNAPHAPVPSANPTPIPIEEPAATNQPKQTTDENQPTRDLQESDSMPESTAATASDSAETRFDTSSPADRNSDGKSSGPDESILSRTTSHSTEELMEKEGGAVDVPQTAPSEPSNPKLEHLKRLRSTILVANFFIPPLWLAASVQSMSGGLSQWIVGLLLSGLMFLAGVLALRSSYVGTLLYWRGEKEGLAPIAGSKTLRQDAKPNPLIERRIPFVSEETSAIVTMTWANMMRAPEVKMFIVMPLVAPLLFLFFTKRSMLPENSYLKALLVSGLAVFFLLVTAGIVGNMFAYDRSGFRTFVLSGIDRRKILLGRNIAYYPVICLITCGCSLLFCLVYRIDLFIVMQVCLATLSIVPLYFLLMNLMSILTPFPMAAGSIQPTHFEMINTMINLLLSTLLPIIMGIALIPLGLQFLLELVIPLGWARCIGVFASLGICAISFGIYAKAIVWEGKLLSRRETEVLRIVTSKAE
jgi:hypothetical protein